MNADGNFPTYEQQQQALTLLQEIGVDIDTLLAGRVVKSVQRGVVTGNGATTPIEIPISTINSSRSFVVINGQGGNTSQTQSIRLNDLTSNVLSLAPTTGTTWAASTFTSWQVIEFY